MGRTWSWPPAAPPVAPISSGSKAAGSRWIPRVMVFGPLDGADAGASCAPAPVDSREGAPDEQALSSMMIASTAGSDDGRRIVTSLRSSILVCSVLHLSRRDY